MSRKVILPANLRLIMGAMIAVSDLNGRLVVIRNLSLYYTSDEVSALDSTLQSIGFPLVNLECSVPVGDVSGKFVIIDEDLCQVVDTS